MSRCSFQCCVKVSQGTVEQFPSLKCSYEEADDRMMYHITRQAVDRLYYQRVFVCSGDTDVFVSFTLKPNGNVNKLTSFG